MSIRQEFLLLIEQLTDEQLALLLPVVKVMQDKPASVFSSQSSQAYQEWVSTENDIYDELFDDELAAR